MVAKAFLAQYDGRCAGCDQPFKAGARVRYVSLDEDEEDEIFLDHACRHEPDRVPSATEQALARRDMCLDCCLVHAPGQKECE